MEQIRTDMEKLTAFWDHAFQQFEQEYAQIDSSKGMKQLAPAEELYLAAQSLGKRKKVLDYGCGSGWAGLAAAAGGCEDVTCADTSPAAVRTAEKLAEMFGVRDRMHFLTIAPDWLRTVPAMTYDGFFCSNVLDVVPQEVSEKIIGQAARALADDASAIIGLNYCLSPEEGEKRSLAMAGRNLYVDGILRLVSFSDEEWAERFSAFFTVARLEHFAWPNEKEKRRRLFYLKKNGPKAGQRRLYEAHTCLRKSLVLSL